MYLDELDNCVTTKNNKNTFVSTNVQHIYLAYFRVLYRVYFHQVYSIKYTPSSILDGGQAWVHFSKQIYFFDKKSSRSFYTTFYESYFGYLFSVLKQV